MSNAVITETLHELPIDFSFTDQERDGLTRTFLSISENPYTAYEKFSAEVRTAIDNELVPQRFVDFCEAQKLIDRVSSPFLSLTNCPLDPELPVWDNRDPVNDKRRRKTTFVAEGFLEVYSALMGQPVITYINVNDGDRFQDIYPKEDLKETQSQKAIVPLYFHKDLANHFVRPDYVNMLSMRAHPGNETYTTFVCNADALARLDSETKATLREVEFYTPFDDLSVKGGNKELGRAADHPVLSGDYDLRYFENRTVGISPRAKQAVDRLNEALHAVKRRVHMMPGDFVSLYNNFSVHSKELHKIADPEALAQRWIIKTVNVDDLAAHEQHYLPDAYGVVNG